MFDGFLRARATGTGGEFVLFDPVRDYEQYVDGKLRYDGVRSPRLSNCATLTPSS
jgi:hypothetical protein